MNFILINIIDNISIPSIIGIIAIVLLLSYALTNLGNVFFDWRKNYSIFFIFSCSIAVPLIFFFKGIIPNAFYPVEIESFLLTEVLLVLASVIAILLRVLYKIEGIEALQSKKIIWASDEVMQIISKAKKEVSLLQTWFPDAARIGDVIIENFDKINRPINVKIFLFYPGKINECGGISRFEAINNENLQSTSKAILVESGFLCQIISSLDNFIQRLEKTQNITASIYLYKGEKPGSKVYLIDDKFCLYSLYEDHTGSTNNEAKYVGLNMLKRKDIEFETAKRQILNIESRRPELYYKKVPCQQGIFPMKRLSFTNTSVQWI